MYRIVLSLIFLCCISCTSNKTEVKLNAINGYWEIKQVEIPNKEPIQYAINETIDFIEIKNDSGFRQKVMPKIDGTYQTNGIKESLKIVRNNDGIFINCFTNYSNWKEEIIELTDSIMVLKNKENIFYHYKKYVPFSLK